MSPKARVSIPSSPFASPAPGLLPLSRRTELSPRRRCPGAFAGCPAIARAGRAAAAGEPSRPAADPARNRHDCAGFSASGQFSLRREQHQPAAAPRSAVTRRCRPGGGPGERRGCPEGQRREGGQGLPRGGGGRGCPGDGAACPAPRGRRPGQRGGSSGAAHTGARRTRPRPAAASPAPRTRPPARRGGSRLPRIVRPRRPPAAPAGSRPLCRRPAPTTRNRRRRSRRG